MWGHKCSQGQFTYSPAKGQQLPQEAETGCRGTEGHGEGPGCGDRGRRGGAVLTELGLAWTWGADAAPFPHVKAMELASAGPLWDLTELLSHSARPLVPLALGSNSPTLSLARPCPDLGSACVGCGALLDPGGLPPAWCPCRSSPLLTAVLAPTWRRGHHLFD